MITATDPAPVEPPDSGAADAARARLSTLEHGPTALGELADLATWAASVRGEAPAPPFTRPRCLLLVADHGVAREPSLPRARAVLDGTAPQALLARTAGVEVRVIDVGLSEELPGVESRPVRRGSGPIDSADALTADEVLDAVGLGRALVDEEVDSGTDLLIPAAISVDAGLPATATIATLSRTEPIWALGFGAITDDAEWSRWCGVVRDARRRAGGRGDEAFAVLAAIGGADLAVLTGILVQAAVRRTPVLLDGTVGAAAGLLAREFAAEAPHWWRAPQRNGSASERTALEMLQLEPSVALGLRLGEGCGALATVPLLQTAVTALAALSTEPPAKPEPEPADDADPDDPDRDDPFVAEEWPDPADSAADSADADTGSEPAGPAANPTGPRGEPGGPGPDPTRDG
jgi:nicotinate-nucleotide--dimethylbenzimidazole phosphoribosyltransferase